MILTNPCILQWSMYKKGEIKIACKQNERYRQARLNLVKRKTCQKIKK